MTRLVAALMLAHLLAIGEVHTAANVVPASSIGSVDVHLTP